MAGFSSQFPGDAFVEGLAQGVSMPVGDTPVEFSNLHGFTAGGQDANGWVDVRSLDNLVVLVTANSQDGTYTLESKRTSIDPVTNTLVAATAVTADTTTELFNTKTNGDIIEWSHIRLLHRYTTTSGGTTTASLVAQD